MVSLEAIALAALDGEALTLRSLVQDWLRAGTPLCDVACPSTRDPAVLAVAAAIAELCAEHTGQAAPAWTSVVAGLPEERFLVRAAATMRNLRRMCQEEAPLPLKRRNLFAPADYLRFM